MGNASKVGVSMYMGVVCVVYAGFPFLKVGNYGGSSYTVENASNAAIKPSSPEMKPALVAVGSATVAVLLQSSGIAAIFCHEVGSCGLQ